MWFLDRMDATMFGENAIDICCYSEAVDMSASYAAHASSILGVGNKS
jgi:hypothetical protein